MLENLSKRANLFRIWEIIEQNDNFLLTLHPSPDLDSICSNYVMLHLLKNRGKSAVLISGDNFNPGQFSFIPEFISEIENKNIFEKRFDALLALDISRPERISANLTITGEEKFNLINIDHHLNNSFSDNVYLDVEASSTCEIIFLLAQINNLELSDKMLQALYLGMYDDTAGFTLQTSSNTLFFAGEIKGRTAIDGVITVAKKQWTLADLNILPKIISNYTVENIYGVSVGILVTEEKFEIKKLQNFLSSQKEEIIIISTKEEYFRIEIICWLPVEKAVARKIAEKLNGGGHANRAGGKELILTNVSEIKNKIISATKEVLVP